MIFDDTYEIILAGLISELKEPQFSRELVQEELDSFYHLEGLNWAGRGDVKQAEIEGTILAYQAFLMRYDSGKYTT